MKKAIIAFSTFITILFTTSPLYSDDRLLTGTLLGAGGGALIGQAIGGDTESTLVGTFIGGAIGLAAGSSYHDGHGSSSVRFKYSSHHPHHYHRVHKPYRYYDRHYRKYHHRPHYKHYRKHVYRDHPKHYRKSWQHKRYHYSHPGSRIIVKKVYKYDDGHIVKRHVIRERRHHRHDGYYRGYGKRYDNRQYHVRYWKRYHK